VPDAEHNLRRCPFCGGAASQPEQNEGDFDGVECWVIECQDCEMLMFGESEADVIENWQRRQ